MTKTFFSIEQGSHPSLGSLAGKDARPVFVNSPGFFLSTPSGVSMNPYHAYKGGITIQERIKIQSRLIQCTKNYIAGYLPDPRALEEVLKGKDQLRRQEKELKQMEEAERCQ